MALKTSSNGLALIKKFEGCRLTAYKAVSTEKYYTIGYGHYGSDVKAGMTITQAQADEYLKSDLAKFEKYVNAYGLSWINQNRFDALVSFVYNCGAGNLKTLLNNGKRTAAEVSAKFASYNKAGGKVLAGLTKRRAAEKALFDTAVASSYIYKNVDYSKVFDPTYYADLYSDLKSAYGTDATKLFEHFCVYGMAEGRQACKDFNVMAYKSKNEDLQEAFGAELPKYYEHYCVYGYKEGRISA